jgi:sec-independent protein translocase protein TatC
MSSPLGTPLYYSDPSGGFSFVMKVCFTCGLVLSIPVLIYNSIMFVRPAFKNILTVKYVIRISIFSTLLAIAGAVFAYICILPGTLDFFKGFDGSGLSALISADSYLSFLTNLIIMFVIVFQIPLVISIIDRIKPIPPKKLLKYEGPVIFICIFASLFAPFTYDLFTNLIFAGPMIILYNLSIVVIAVNHMKKPKKSPIIQSPVILENPIKTLQTQLPIPTSVPIDKRPVQIRKTMDIKTKHKYRQPMSTKQQPIAKKQPAIRPYIRPSRLVFDILPTTKTSHA